MRCTALSQLEIRRRLPLLLAAAGTLALLLGGCSDVPPRDAIVAEIGEQFPAAQFTLEEHVHLGPVVMWLARRVVGVAAAHSDDADTRQAAGIVSDMREVEVATYRVRNVDSVADLQYPKAVEQLLARRGWTTFVRVTNRNEQTLVLAHQQNGEQMDGLFVLAMEPHELTLVRVDGRLDKALALALAKSPRSVLDGKHNRQRESAPATDAAADATPAKPADGESTIALASDPPPSR